MTRVAVVTDATADLPDELSTARRPLVVPLSVAFGDEVSSTDGSSADAARFYTRLAAADVAPMTSQPPPPAFDEVYAACARDGFERVVSVHCSAVLSGTFAVARDAARRAPLPVEVIDSRLVGGSLGLAVLAAQRAADAGAGAGVVIDEIARVRDTSIGLIVVDSLEYLRRGGRLSAAQATVGGALRVKPILRLHDGAIVVDERVRTFSRALERLVAIAAEQHRGTVDVAIVHAMTEERATELERHASVQLRVGDLWRATIGPVVGTHVGPGAVGIAVVPHA